MLVEAFGIRANDVGGMRFFASLYDIFRIDTSMTAYVGLAELNGMLQQRLVAEQGYWQQSQLDRGGRHSIHM